jgi:CHAD domain-containing protein
MNSRSLASDGGRDAPLRPIREPQVQSWLELVEQCSERPSRKRVHLLRSATLRLMAVQELRLRGHAAGAEAERAFDRWKKEGKKLRRALSPLRDADVHRERLAAFGEELAARLGAEPLKKGRYLREIGLVDGRLQELRKAKSVELEEWLDHRRKHLFRLSREMETALSAPPASAVESTAEAALQLLASLNAEFPHLDGANLHDYRKRLKAAVYLAELSAGFDPQARQLAATLRKMQDAAGQWHDWEALAREAARVLSGEDETGGLASLLGKTAEKALRQTLSLCRRSTERLLNEAARDGACPDPLPMAETKRSRARRTLPAPQNAA